VKYLDASTMTSGSFQNNAAITYEIKKRKIIEYRSENETLDDKYAGINPAKRIGKISITFALLNTHCQLVSLLSSSDLLIKRAIKARSISSEITITFVSILLDTFINTT
jgi:hypothetical protein